MEKVGDIIIIIMKGLLKDGIKYTKFGDSEYYAQELFDSEELTDYSEQNMIRSGKSIYDYVVYDSNVERGFAEDFEKDDSIKLYAKLPAWFKIQTPIGSYNPDWAIVIEKNNQKKLYFVVETKGDISNLKPSERYKIECGKKHFRAMGCDVEFKEVDSFDNFLNKIL